MKLPSNKLTNNDLISGLVIIVLVNSVAADANNDYCKERRFPNAISSIYMQFTKEIVSQEYAIEGEFKNLHCCAKGYRSIEWFKDGKSYPWSTEDTSSLIVYPQAANQTIFARKTSKVDEGRYTCVLRNDTHKIEHRIQLKVLESSPDVPLATFSPGNQFADVGGSARFFCEAFVGKKDLPDIAISIRWYHVLDQDRDLLVDETLQEVVKREEEQIIGSYLTISKISLNDYGRYMCRVEMGNSQTHRLELSAELINALPIEADFNSILFNPYVLAFCAALLTVIMFFLLLHTQQCWSKILVNNNLNELEILNMKTKHLNTPPSIPKMKKSNAHKNSSFDDTKIMIDVI